MTRALKLSVCVLAIALSGCVAEKKDSLTVADAGTFKFASPGSYWNGQPVDLVGTLSFPEKMTGKVPVMVIMHGSAGRGYRDRTWSKFFLENGVATFQVDYYSTRGLTRGGQGGPKSPQDLTGAVKFVTTHPNIDATRVGTLGFSRGGTIVLSSWGMNANDFGGHKPVFNVALYPGCEAISISRGTTDAQNVIIVGDRDTLSRATVCEGLGQQAQRNGKNVAVHVMPGGTHSFDDDTGGTVQFGGMTVTISPNSALAQQARDIVRAAMVQAFKL